MSQEQLFHPRMAQLLLCPDLSRAQPGVTDGAAGRDEGNRDAGRGLAHRGLAHRDTGRGLAHRDLAHRDTGRGLELGDAAGTWYLGRHPLPWRSMAVGVRMSRSPVPGWC